MTVTYSLSVANARLTGFSRLLLRWKGSIYKLLYREMAIFCGAYYGLSGTYRYLLSDSQRILFEKLSLYCEAFTHYIPLSFVLGFYVTLVVSRWWQQYLQIPWPDKCLILISGYIHGVDERGRLIRRTLARYLLLMQVFTCQAVSVAIFKRFPTLDHIEEAGFITPEEREVYERVPGDHGKWWVPAQWFQGLAVKARKEGRIREDIHLYQILEEMHILRGYCGMMFAYDWISIPLVYTQTVTIATYTYFLATLMGRQYLDPSKGYQGHEVDLYIPIFTVLEFFFFMGWLKVAEQLINGYGEDDDDFDLHWILERNTILSFYIVDNMHNESPKLTKDKFWDDPKPILPHTKSSMSFRHQPFLGSAMDLRLDPEEVEVVQMPPIDEEETEQQYSSSPATPNLIDIESTTDREETVSRNRFLPDFRGSRFMNMLIGQSCDNVSNGRIRHFRNEKNTAMFPPFLLKTPQKRSRTMSLADSMNHNSMNMKEMITRDPRSFPHHTFGDLPTAPIAMGAYRQSPAPSRRESNTPMHELRSLRDDDSVQGLEIGMLSGSSRGHRLGFDDQARSFRYPSYVKNPAQYFPSHLMLSGEQDVQDQSPSLEPSKCGTPNMSSHNIRMPSRCNSKTDSYFAEEADQPAPIATSEKPDIPVNNTGNVINSPESNLSEESLSPLESNEGTVTSITELLKSDKQSD